MNNFNQSSTGINLELSCFKDIMQSQDLFSENFKRDYYLNDYFHFVSYGEFETIDLLDLENYNFTKSNLIDCIFSFENEEWVRDNYNGSFSKATKADLIEYWDNYISGSFSSNDLIEYYIENFKPKFEIVVVKGYCQGDQANVIFSHDHIKQYEFECMEKFIGGMSEYFENLFYGAPIYARLNIGIDGESDDIYIDGILTDLYEWDRDLIIESVKTDNTLTGYTKGEKTYIIEWLENNLPSDLDYV